MYIHEEIELLLEVRAENLLITEGNQKCEQLCFFYGQKKKFH